MNSHREQLKNVRAALVSRGVGSGFPFTPAGWKKEGEDHINISTSSSEVLGRMLSIRNTIPFTHPVLGDFSSLNSLWYFIRAKNPCDELRSYSNFAQMKYFFKTNCGGERLHVPMFRAMILHSCYVRILQNEDLTHRMIQSKLPFDSYSIIRESGLPQRFEYTLWFVRGHEEIRKALQERREPDFKEFYDGKLVNDNIYYQFLLELIGDPERVVTPDLSGWTEYRWSKYDAYVERKQAKEKARNAHQAQMEARKIAVESGILKKKKNKKNRDQTTSLVHADESAVVTEDDVVENALNVVSECQNCEECKCGSEVIHNPLQNTTETISKDKTTLAVVDVYSTGVVDGQTDVNSPEAIQEFKELAQSLGLTEEKHEEASAETTSVEV